MCNCPAHFGLVDCTCRCDHTADRMLQWRARADALAATVQRVRALCDEADAMNPEDYKTGQEHFTPAFREINFQDAFMALAKIINRIEAALAPSAPATDTGGERM